MNLKKSYQGIRTNQEKYYPDKIEKILTGDPKIKKWEKFMKKKNEFLKNQHNLAIKILEESPLLAGIYEKVKPISNFKTKYKDEYGETDLILLGKHRVFYVEYKCEDTLFNREKAIEQLERTKNHLPKKYKKDMTNLLYIHGNFEVDEWIPEEGWKEWRKIPEKYKIISNQ
jgi:hypothetical protein